MSQRPFRVRFAPSPTGFFHVGGARTALYNHIVANQAGGTFVLRVEDTDAERNRPEWTQGILDAMRWIGAEWDEGPYFQSERADLYQAAAAKLLADGAAYYCDCTRDALLARTGDPNRGYDGHCRDRGLGPAPGRAMRFRTPDEGTTQVVDVIRGEPSFENALLEDFVVVRGNGQAIFLLANVVDDIEMAISHVIRGEEHLPNTPKAQLLWGALGGGELPVWAHVPVLVNEKRQKLSKRRDKVALEQYRDEGYLADAMRNYLMTLGWAPAGDSEIVPWSVIEETFRLEDVNSSPAFFDLKKLAAFNGEYVRAMTVDEFVTAARPWLDGDRAPWPAERFDEQAFRAMAPLVQERVTTLAEVPDYVDFLFLDEAPIDDASWQRAMKADAQAILSEVAAEYTTVDWSAEALKAALDAVGQRHGLKLAKAQAPVRVAVTGRTIGPPLFESLVQIGRERTLARLRTAVERM
jgi:glutamyl-tRNA synthetase